MHLNTNTDIQLVIDELGAGSLKPALESIASKVALAVMVHGSEKPSGSIKLELTFAQTAESDQLGIGYKLSHVLPTNKGKQSEERRGASAFFVGRGGRISVNAPVEAWNGQKDMFYGDAD